MADVQAGQAAIATHAAEQMRAMLPQIDPQVQWQQLVAWLYQLVQRYGKASASLSVVQYGDARRLARVPGTYRPFPADPAPLDQVARTAGWALHPVLQPTDAPVDLAQVHDTLTAAMERLILDAGRQTITGNVEADRRAKGWARLAEPDACSWCALLTTRGAVYKSEQSALTRKSDGDGFHTNCRCHVEPVFGVYEMTAQAREWAQRYRDATAGVRGSKAKQIAWRRAYEGRTDVPAVPGDNQHSPQEGASA